MLAVLVCGLFAFVGSKESIRNELAAIDRMLDTYPPLLEKALPLLVDLAKRKPKNRRVRVNLANVYAGLDMQIKAETHLRKLVKISKARYKSDKTTKKFALDYADSSYLLAKHLLRVKAPQKEIMAALEVTVREDPSHDNAKHWLAHQLSRAPQVYCLAQKFLLTVFPCILTTGRNSMCGAAQFYSTGEAD